MMWCYSDLVTEKTKRTLTGLRSPARLETVLGVEFHRFKAVGATFGLFWNDLNLNIHL